MGKNKPKLAKPASDEPRGTLEHIFLEAGYMPDRKTLNRLIRFWEVSTGQAQVRGERIREKVEAEKEGD
jgi:hypothetical protein